MIRVTDRRDFLKQSGQAAAGFSLLGLGAGNKKPMFKISLAEWSLHRALFSKKLDNLDVP